MNRTISASGLCWIINKIRDHPFKTSANFHKFLTPTPYCRQFFSTIHRQIWKNFDITFGTIHLRRRHVSGGKGSKICQICWQIVLKHCHNRGVGVKNLWKFADVLNWWSLLKKPTFKNLNSKNCRAYLVIDFKGLNVKVPELVPRELRNDKLFLV